MAKGLIIAAPSSGSGKTVMTLGLIRALRNQGVDVASAKIGPDYIDPRFHEIAAGKPCFNLDGWAMSTSTMSNLLARTNAEFVIIEGVMGLFDGPQESQGSTADVAADLGVPVILVVDASHQAQSVAALVHGFRTFRPALNVAGVILNRVASERHRDLLVQALQSIDVLVFGYVMRDAELALPSRHLGLVQAMEVPGIENFISRAADKISSGVDLAALMAAAQNLATGDRAPALPPLGQTMAVASDEAFAFCYRHLLEGWRDAGAEILLFSPLADESPSPRADAIFLPGGYPELHAGRLAGAQKFLEGLRSSTAPIYGECGGYMVLGEYLVDAEQNRHKMAGLLPLGTSFAKRKLHLGYRMLKHNGSLPFPAELRGHEFHYSTVDWQGAGDPLFDARDAAGHQIGNMGLRRGKVMGSYAHVIA